VGQDGTTDEAGISSRGISRRTLLKGGAVVGTALWVAPVVETFAGSSTAAGASEAQAGSLAPAPLSSMALATAASQGSQTCNPTWAGYTMPITEECIDPRYHHVPYPQPNVTPQLFEPYIDVNEPRQTTVNKVPYQYVHGGFTGTAATFALYFPPENQYQGRFFQSTYPVVVPPFGSGGDAESDANIEFSIASGGYAVHTNQGGSEGIMSTSDDLVRHLDPSWGAYRVNAAAAKFSRLVAQQIYNNRHRPYGYMYGASGGAFQTVAAAENTIGVWDGFVPEVMGTPNSIVSNFTIVAYAERVISSASFAKVVDALAPGGSGDPFAVLANETEVAALHEAARLGFPLRGWWDYASLTSDKFLLTLTDGYVLTLDPSYVVDFWSQPGYEGTDLNSSIGSLRVQTDPNHPFTVQSVIPPNPPLPQLLVVSPNLPARDLTGAYMTFASGAAAGQLIPVGIPANLNANTLTIGFGGPPQASQIKAGDQFTIDNSWYLALQTYHRHQIPPPDANLYAWDQYRNPDGTPKYPQREILTGPVGSAGPTGDSSGALFGPGAIQNGRFHGKMIALASLMDNSAFPWSTDWYRQRAQAAHGGNLDRNFRVWYTDNADHGGPPNKAAQAITVGYPGALQQALRDVAAWAEQGIPPPASTNYDVVETQVQVPPTAKKRRGIQPVVSLAADGRLVAQVAVGDSVSFSADAEVPPGAGQIVKVEFDPLGQGNYSNVPKVPISSSVHVPLPPNSYSASGTYFPVVRVTSQRHGDATTPYGRVQNLARARVIVQ
jgi:hypothetical protein